LLWAKLFGHRQPGTGRTIAAGGAGWIASKAWLSAAYRPWPIRPCLPPSPEHARRWRARRLPSRPRSRTDERARCPPWFSAVPAVSDRTGCSAASNWGKDPRRTVRPAQRSVTPRSARSCRRAGTVTADGMALPREQCVGADGEAPGRSPAESYFRAPQDWWSAFTALGQAAGATATRDRLGSVARLLRIRSCLTLAARPGGWPTGRRHLCQHCGEARVAYCVQTGLPIHLINLSLFVTGRKQIVKSRRSRPRTSADGRAVKRSKFKSTAPGLDTGLAGDLRWFVSLEGAALLTPPGGESRDQDSKCSVTVAFPVIQALALALAADIPIRCSPDGINVSRRSRHRR
jgi:hypothetical protein